MALPEPRLAVQGPAEAFDSHWSELADRLGLVLQRSEDVEGVPRTRVVAVLLTCAGRESHALELLLDAQSAGIDDPLVVGAAADHHLAVELMRRGAAGYFALPGDAERLEGELRRRLEVLRSRPEEPVSREEDYDFSSMVGRDPALRKALERAARAIPGGRATVLISGETGTGKELLARAVHDNGPRAREPFVAVNCSAIPENLLESELFGHEKGAFTGAHAAKPGLFQTADGGTLFLDEVSLLPLPLQGKLLRVLETGEVRRVGGTRTTEVDVRILAAANVDLRERVAAGEFREDLYYRLAVMPVHLPPLRERGEDVRRLARHFLGTLAEEYDMETPELTPEALRRLVRHPWPGNVRELRNALERGLLLSDGGPIEPSHLALEETATGGWSREGGGSSTGGLPFPATLEELEIAAARRMIELADGNKSEAARRLGIPRSRLYRILERDAE